MEILLVLEMVMGCVSVACLFAGLGHNDDINYYRQIYRHNPVIHSRISQARKLRNYCFLASGLSVSVTLICVVVIRYNTFV